MPIRINLLAEAHAAEELRRKDPVKRGIYGAVVVVSCVLIWALTLQLKIMAAKHELPHKFWETAANVEGQGRLF